METNRPSAEVMNSHIIMNVIVFVVGACAYLIVCPPIDSFLENADNCSPLAFLENIRSGEVIYKDFLVHFPPGIYYLVYAVMRICENNFLGYVTLICLGNALVSLFVFKIASELFGTISAVISFSLSILLHPVMYKWYLCAFPLVSIFYYLMYLKDYPGSSSRVRKIMLSGIFAGLGGYFRLDTAAYVIIAILIAQLVRIYRYRMLDQECFDDGSKSRLSEIKRHSAAFVISAGFTAIPFSLIGLYYGLIGDMWESLVVLGLMMPRAMALPYPSIKVVPSLAGALLLRGDTTQIWLCLFFVIPVVYTSYACTIMRISIFSSSASMVLRCVKEIPLAVFGFLLFLQATHRSDFAHLLQVATIFWIIVPGVLIRAARGRFRLLAVVSLPFAALVLISALAHEGRLKWPSQTVIAEKLNGYFHGVEAFPDHPVSRLAKYVQTNSDPSDSLLVVSHSIQICYFARRKFAGGLAYYLPWDKEVYEIVQQRLLAQKSSIALVVTLADFKFDNMGERSLKMFAPGVYAFIKTSFCCTIRTGDYLVFKPVQTNQKCLELPNCEF